MNRGKTALITGATSGIGAVFAQRFASQGYNLILTGRRKEKIEAVAGELREQYNITIDVHIAELSDDNDIEHIITIIKDNEHLEILVNNAGFGKKNTITEEDGVIYEKMIKVHCLATMKFTRATLPGMIKNGTGAIINVSSVAAFFPLPRNSVYSATKSFINYFSETVHFELIGTGVKIQALCPGMTRTDFHTRIGMDASKVYKDKGLGKAMTPEEVVDISLQCLKKDAVICVPGWNNKFLSLLPRLLPKSILYKMLLFFKKND